MYACLYAPGNLAVLLECAQYFSPHIEQTSADTVVLRIDGLEQLFGPPDQLAAAIVNRIGIPAQIALLPSLTPQFMLLAGSPV